MEKASQVFKELKPTMKIDNYVSNALEVGQKLLNLTLTQIDLKNTENIMSKFRFGQDQ